MVERPNMAEGSSNAGPETGSSQLSPETPQATLNRVKEAASRLNQPGALSPEQIAQRKQAIKTVLGGVIELHKQGVIGRDEAVRNTLQQDVFTNDPQHKELAETLVAGIEGVAKSNDPQKALSVPSLLKLSSLLGINDKDRHPDLAKRLERISVEYETSPERGRFIVKEIVRLETTLEYTARYAVKTGLLSSTNPEIYNERIGSTYLDQLYADLKNYDRGLRKIRNDRDIKDPFDQEHVYAEMAANMARLAEQKEAATHREYGKRPDALPTAPVAEIWEKYLHPSADTDLEAVEAELATYFLEGRGLGLLQLGDAIFTSTYNQIVRGKMQPGQDPQEVLKSNVDFAKQAIDRFFRTQRKKPEVDRMKLAGLAEAYAERTFDMFEQLLNGEKPSTREGEFSFEEGTDLTDEDKETYWRPGHYPKMYEILARTEQQFRSAADSFLKMVTKGSIGKSPDDLYQHFENFKDALGQVGSQQEQAGIVESEFMENLRVEMEAHGFIFGADYSNETYNPKSFNQFMMAMALHEGPQRWVRLARSGNGQVGAFLWKFDNDPRVTLLHNTGGSRGQLLSDTITQHYLHNEIKNILIEEGMGVVLKDYDPRDLKCIANDPDSIKVLNDPVAEEERIKYFKANQERIGIHQKKKDFKGLYENFDTGDTHIANYERYKDLDENERKKLSTNLRRSFVIGKVQFMLQGKEGRNREQLSQAIEGLIREGRLTQREKRIWEEAYGQTKANFDVAIQMVGASGEKARRGGGVFFVDRKDEHGHKFVDNVPVYQAEKWVQYVVTRTKIQHASSKAIDRYNAVERDRALAIQQFKEKGFDAALTFPKLRFNTDLNSPNFGDVTGTEGTETIDFDTAVKSLYSRWTNHTYWSYQPENRHMLTDPDTFAAAKRIRAGLSRPEDEDNLASFLLLIDPTLKRVARIEDTQVRDGESAQQEEIMIFDAAVEASNQGHWTIVRELNAKFMPKDGNPFKMRTGYNLEDYGGISRFIIRMRQFVASNPNRFARRYAAEIANLPVNVSSMPDQFGQEGVLGAIEMMADPIGAMADQREVSQFAITKWVEQMRIGNMLYGALVGQVDSERGFSIEGLFEKPTNNSDKLHQLEDTLADQRAGVEKDVEDQMMYAMLESLDRLWTVLKLVRTMESDTRNASGALQLEKTEIFLANGNVNPEIALDTKSGTSRETERQFFDLYIKWLAEGQGQEVYAAEGWWYKRLLEKTILDPKGKMTRADWLFNKMGR